MRSQILLWIRAAVLVTFFSGISTTGRAQNPQRPTLPENFLSFPNKTYELDFQWQGDSLHGGWEPYAAMLLPVTLPGCSQRLFMQFDLGSPSSVLYNAKLLDIHAKYPKAITLTDTTTALQNVSFKVGKMPVLASAITVRQVGARSVPGSSWKEPVIIGTLGTDVIDGRVVAIDYPRKRLTLYPGLPKSIQPSELSGFVYTSRSVLLPATIKGKQTMLFFDTGTSGFELLTDRSTYQLLSSPGAIEKEYQVRSWNRFMTAHSSASSDSLMISSKQIPLRMVTYMEGASSAQIDQMIKLGIGGMIGNRLFLNSILVLDTRNKKFGLFH